jgi:hypothetical protein
MGGWNKRMVSLGFNFPVNNLIQSMYLIEYDMTVGGNLTWCL